jgi:acyl dehydratase
LPDLARYAEASGDLNPLHLDLEFARQAGFENLVVHGMLGMAQLGWLLSEAFPIESIRSFQVRFEGVVIVGQSVRYSARLGQLTDSEVDLALEASLESGVRVMVGRALVVRRGF